jgi:hypothetical protein
MRSRLFFLLCGIAWAGPAVADPVGGATRLLCSAANVGVCVDSGECEVGPAWTLDVPEFIEVDLTKKTLSSTPASGENRISHVANMTREGGTIVLQGFERGRAYSISIEEENGRLTAAVARHGLGLVVFGQCTPLPEGARR